MPKFLMAVRIELIAVTAEAASACKYATPGAVGAEIAEA